MLRCPKCQAELDDDRTICPRDGVILLGADDQEVFAHRLASGTPVAEYVIDEPIGCGTFGDVSRRRS
jgi:hypothetical protein